MESMMEYRRLEVDDNWTIKVPVNLWERIPRSEARLADANLNVSTANDGFELLLEALIHEGALIDPGTAVIADKPARSAFRLAEARSFNRTEDEAFEMLLEALIHEGVLIAPSLIADPEVESAADHDFEMLLEALSHEGLLIVPGPADALQSPAASSSRPAEASAKSSSGEEGFDMLLEALAHEGVLIMGNFS